MAIKKVVNKNVIAFDFYMDITKSNLLPYLCTECRLEDLFIEIYAVQKSEINIFRRLLQMGFDIVKIPYIDGTQDVAIKMNARELPTLFSTLSEYDFGEITVWDANERWEQHLFLKSTHRRTYVENEHKLYLCYNHSEKKVELYLDPNYDSEKINSLIKEYTILETTRMKVKYSNRLNKEICTFEDHMLGIYTEKVQAYARSFEAVGCTLEVGLMWKNFFDADTVAFQRGDFRNGYECYVYCSVQRDGQEVRIPSNDGEVDYYDMSTAWRISSIRRFFFKLELSLYVDTDDIESDLENFLICIKNNE